MTDQVRAWAGDEDALGNLTTVLEAASDRGPTVGAGGGARAVARAIGIAPWWLRSPPTPADRTFEVFESPSAIMAGSALAALLALCAVLVVATRRGRSDVVAACSTALVLCAALATMTSSFPNRPGTIFSYSYASWWAAPAGMFVWLVLGWSLCALDRGRVMRRIGASPSVVVPLGLLLIVALGSVSAVGTGQSVSDRQVHEAVRTVVKRVETVVPAPTSVRVRGPSFGFEAAIVYSMRRRGAHVETGLANELGRSYKVTDRRVGRVLTVNDGLGLPAGARLVAQVRIPPPTRRMVTVGALPGS